jgi:hypothetical protein
LKGFSIRNSFVELGTAIGGGQEMKLAGVEHLLVETENLSQRGVRLIRRVRHTLPFITDRDEAVDSILLSPRSIGFSPVFPPEKPENIRLWRDYVHFPPFFFGFSSPNQGRKPRLFD